MFKTGGRALVTALTALAVLAPPVLMASSSARASSILPAPPQLVGDWTFASGAPVETTGHWTTFTPHGAVVENGQLKVTGTGNGNDAATAWAEAGGYTGPVITDKTMISWVKLDSADVSSGAPIALYNQVAGDVFDAVDYAENSPNQWMEGSNNGVRNAAFVPGQADTDTTLVRQVAISYQQNIDGSQTITGCLNGTQLGSYSTGGVQAFDQTSKALFGPRHESGGVTPVGSIDAHISESRIYASAMSCDQVAALPNPAAPSATATSDPIALANRTAVPAQVTATSSDTSTVDVVLTDQNGATATGQPVTFEANDSAPQTIYVDASALSDGPVRATGTVFDTVNGNNGPLTGNTVDKDTTVATGVVAVDTNPIDNAHQSAVQVSAERTDSGSDTATVSIQLCDQASACTTAQTTPADTAGAQYWFDTTRLANGTVTATATFTDAAGNTSTATSTALKSTVAAPSAPQHVTATQTGPGQVTLTWDPPSAGDPATGYYVDLNDGAAYDAHATVSASTTSYVFDNVPNGTQNALVHATNAGGTSPDGTATVRVGTAPSAPLNVAASQTGPGQVTITWSAPADAGSDPVTRYDAGYGGGQLGDGGHFDATTRSAVFDGLSDGTYTAGVNAANVIGSGPQTSTSFTITTVQPAPVPVPPAPTSTPSPSDSPSPSTSPSQACTAPALTVTTPEIVAGRAATAYVTGTPGDFVKIDAYSRPDTAYRTVRSYAVVPATGRVDYTFTPGTNTRLYAVSKGCAAVSRSAVIAVHLIVSINAVRTGAGEYTFSGRMLPSAQNEGRLVTLYYRSGSSTVIKGRGRVQQGIVRIPVTFTGRGALEFFLLSGSDMVNLAGQSKDLPVTVQ